jgi:hypothetical protein
MADHAHPSHGIVQGLVVSLDYCAVGVLDFYDGGWSATGPWIRRWWRGCSKNGMANSRMVERKIKNDGGALLTLDGEVGCDG